MPETKKIGIWIDHSSAHLIEYASDPIATRIIASKFTHQEKLGSIVKGENLMHNKEQHQQAEYYKELGKIILNYSEVLLFGPTDAKAELFNILRADHRFTNVGIVLKQTGKMTENQQHAFVWEYFSNR